MARRGLAAAVVLAALAPAAPVLAYEEGLGGVNLTAYCARVFGSAFKAVSLGATALNWVCQKGSDARERRPISVQTACEQQYSKYAAVVKAKSGAGALSWVCILQYDERPARLVEYCATQNGINWSAMYVGPAPLDWACYNRDNDHQRRAVDPLAVCKVQLAQLKLGVKVIPGPVVAGRPGLPICLSGPRR